MLRDLQFALRTFAKAPGFVAVAVLVTALGIGANTAIFSVVRAVILRELPFRDPDRLVMIWHRNPKLTDFLAERFPVSLATYFELKKSTRSFSAMTVYDLNTYTLTGVAKPEDLKISFAAPDFPEVFGVRPLIGRMFADGEMHVAILSHGLFTRLFGGDVRRIGSSIELNGEPYKVIGVWAADFQMPAMWQGLDQTIADVWLPMDLRPEPAESFRNPSRFIYAKLAPGATVAQARAEADVVQQRIRREHPEFDAGLAFNIFPVAEEDVGPSTRRYVLLLQGAVGLVLLIACANVANLLLARSVARRQEIAVRIALGAAKWRIARQIVSESLILSAFGGMLGVLFAWGATRGMTAMAPRDTPHLHEFHLDSWAVLFAAAITMLSGIIFGLAPAFDAARRNLNEMLNLGGRSGSSALSRRLRGALVAGEVALAMVLLIGAGLLIRTLQAMFAADPGFRRQGLISIRLNLPHGKYSTEQAMGALTRQLLEKMTAVPGITSAGAANGLPLESLSIASYSIAGEASRPGQAESMAAERIVTEDYFATMMIPLREGRTFTRQEVERADKGVIVVNELLARSVFPGQSAVGKTLRAQKLPRVIIGVVGDARQLGPETAMDAEIYFPSQQARETSFVVRASRDGTALREALSHAVRAVDKDLPDPHIETLDEALGDWVAERKFVMSLLGAFAALAMVLAAAGIYGVLAYSVSQRTREIGVRIAVGASSNDILRLILREGLWIALIGVTFGVMGALALSKLLSGLLFGVSTADPWTFLAGMAGLMIVAALASLVPAIRAARMGPVEALREG